MTRYSFAWWGTGITASPHTFRVPEGEVRYLMIAAGPPALDFLKEVGRAYEDGPTLERLVEIAERHGVKPEFDEMTPG